MVKQSDNSCTEVQVDDPASNITVKRPWTVPDIQDMDVGRNTYNAGPTFLDTGAFS